MFNFGKKKNTSIRNYGSYASFDDDRQEFKFASKETKFKPDQTMNYCDLLEFELILDDSSVAKGGAMGAIVGGALLGPAGFVGGAILGRKNKEIIKSLKIKIIDKNFNIQYLVFTSSKTKSSSSIGKMLLNNAERISDELQRITMLNK